MRYHICNNIYYIYISGWIIDMYLHIDIYYHLCPSTSIGHWKGLPPMMLTAILTHSRLQESNKSWVVYSVARNIFWCNDEIQVLWQPQTHSMHIFPVAQVRQMKWPQTPGWGKLGKSGSQKMIWVVEQTPKKIYTGSCCLFEGLLGGFLVQVDFRGMFRRLLNKTDPTLT